MNRSVLIRGLIALVAIALAYAASPYIAVARFALDVKSGRVERVVQWIDAPRLRQSLASQVVRAYAARSGPIKTMGTFDRRLAGMVAAGYLNALMAEQFPPERIAAMVLGQRDAFAGDAAAQLPALVSLDLHLLGSAGFTRLNRFALDLPHMEGSPTRLVFGLSRAGWRLRSVILPKAIVESLAERLMLQLQS
jgi:hypothetical protein